MTYYPADSRPFCVVRGDRLFASQVLCRRPPGNLRSIAAISCGRSLSRLLARVSDARARESFPGAVILTQREALAVLAELCELSPDARLGQLLAHLGFLGEDETGCTLWDIDDEQLLSAIYRHRAELAARQPDSASQSIKQSGAA